jgi:peptidoglycan/LPS O-acetylase OafA/YrhL
MNVHNPKSGSENLSAFSPRGQEQSFENDEEAHSVNESRQKKKMSINIRPLKYRPDIDGLRAIAVISVLAFHTDALKMFGGFVGVDVFFVISGYLISSIVFGEISASRFSIVSFYERRIRRIFPALFAMLMAFSVFAVVYLLPSELVDYSKSLLAATTSSSNFYFWQHSGYFDLPTSHPLLHTWSLAVEEQFYIFFPLFLLLIRRFFPQRLRVSVLVLCVVSLALSTVVLPYSEVTAFYMPFTRAWELLLGTMISVGMFPRVHSVWLRNLVTLAGLGMIAYAVFFYSMITPFPGLHALVPCIGSALIIGAGESGTSLVGAALSWRPIVFVGLISYSLYLWHWPVIILQKMGVLFSMNTTLPHRYALLFPLHRYDTLIEVTISMVLAILSWRFVERPFRNGSLRLSGWSLFTLAGAVMLICIGFSTWTVLAGGFSRRFPVRSTQVASYLDKSKRGGDATMRVGTCFLTTADRLGDYKYDLCLRQESGKSNYLLLGDSHSAALWMALSASFPDANIMQASIAGCRPFVHPSDSSDCDTMMNYVFQNYLPAHPVRGLLLEARWGPGDISGIAETLQWASKHDIPAILFGPVPEYDVPLPRLLAYSIDRNDPGLAAEHRITRLGPLDGQLQKLAANTWHVPYISLYQEICNDGVCIEYADSAHRVPLMLDEDHLTAPGSLLVIHRLIARGELDLSG